MAIIAIENVTGGFAYSNTDNPIRPVEGADDQYSFAQVIDVFQNNRLGDIAPGNTFDTVSVGTDIRLLLDAVTDSANNAWLVDASGSLYVLDLGTETISNVYSVGTSVLAGTDFVGITAFIDDTGSEWIANSWEHATADEADIRRIRRNGTGNTTAWASGLTSSGKLTKGVPHRLWIGPDGFVYCTNGRYIFQHDPSTSTGNRQALDLGVDWVAQAGVSYKLFSAIIGYKKTTSVGGSALSQLSRSYCQLWLWDGFSPRPNHIFSINDNYVSSIVNKDGVLYIFSQGVERRTRVWIFDGANVKEVATAFTPNIGNAPRHGSVEIFRGFPVWQEGSGNFNIAAIYPRADGTFGMHEIMHANDDETSIVGVGFLRAFRSDANLLYAGIQRGGNRLTKQNTSKFTPQATFTTRLIHLPYRSIIKKVKLFFSQFGAGASFQIGMFKDYDSVSLGGSADLLRLGGTVRTITNTGLGSARQFSILTHIMDVNSFYLHFLFNHSLPTNTAAIIRRIEVEYFPTSIQ